MAEAKEDERELVELRDRGQITIPKDIREQSDTRFYLADVEDDGTITLEPTRLSS